MNCNVKRPSVCWFWVSFTATRFLKAKTADIFSHFSNLSAFELFHDTTSYCSPIRLLTDVSCLTVPAELIFGLVPCIRNLTYWGFLRVHVIMFYLDTLYFPPKITSSYFQSGCQLTNLLLLQVVYQTNYQLTPNVFPRGNPSSHNCWK